MASDFSSQRVREIFESVCELETPSLRRTQAREVCGDDAALWAEVSGLLDAMSLAAAFFPEGSGGFNDLSRAGEAVGDQLGRYRLVEQIGAGGGGIVFRAEQVEPVRREVALKILKPGLETRAVMARFAAERQALAMMDHPGIARVFDGGATPSGRPYFVMELVCGTRVTEFCRLGRLTLRARVDLFIQICHAVQHAHQKGVLHRDLKPSNVLVAGRQDRPQPKIIDFGLAKALDGNLSDGPAVTQGPLFLGTPAYMSPEQAEFGGTNLDTRTDIYSLGVLLYELLTGTTPFDGSRLLNAGFDGMRRIIRDEEPPAPSARVARSDSARNVERGRRVTPEDRPAACGDATGMGQGPRIDSDLDWIALKCLEKDRSRRYPTANDLALDLERYLRDEAVLARPPSRRYRMAKLVRRNRWTFAAGASVALALLVGAMVSTWQAMRARRAERLAQRQAYAADMKSAGVAMAAGNFGSAEDLVLRHRPAGSAPDLRGLEWRYLWKVSRGDEVRSLVQDQWVNCARLTPDGAQVVAALFGGETRVLRVKDGAILRRFPGTGDKYALESIALSSDGRLLAAGSDAGLVVRDTASWQVVRDWPEGPDAVGFSPDGRWFAQANRSGAWVYDSGTWAVRTHWTNQASGFTRLAFSPDSRLLAVAQRERPGVILRAVVGAEPDRELAGLAFPMSVAFSPDGRQLAAGNSLGELAIWTLGDPAVIMRQKAHDRYLFALGYSPDGRTLATGGGDQLIHLWDTRAGSSTGTNGLTRRATLRGHRNEIWSLAYDRDGRTLVSAGRDHTVKFWAATARTGGIADLHLTNHGAGLGFLPSGRQFAILLGSRDAVQVWDVPSARLIRQVPISPLGAVVLNGPVVSFGTTNGAIESWRLPEGERVGRSQLIDRDLSVVQAAVDRDLVLTWDRARTNVALWRLHPVERVRDFPDFAIPELSPFWSITQRAAFSSDGRWLAYASSNYLVKVWDLQRRAEAYRFSGHTWHVQCLRFSPDSTRLGSGGWDASARVWDLRTGREALAPLQHQTGVGCISFSARDDTLLTRSGDDQLHFWSMKTGAETLTVPGVTVWFFDLLAPDGNALGWELGYSGTYRFHFLPTLAEIDRLAP